MTELNFYDASQNVVTTSPNTKVITVQNGLNQTREPFASTAVLADSSTLTFLLDVAEAYNDYCQLAALNDSAIYSLLIKVPFFSRKVSGVTHILSAPYMLPSGLRLIPGDYSGSDHIELGSIITDIRMFNGDASSSYLFRMRK